eukprot:3853103-Pleurochrysis_carterae.AAC.2
MVRDGEIEKAVEPRARKRELMHGARAKMHEKLSARERKHERESKPCARESESENELLIGSERASKKIAKERRKSEEKRVQAAAGTGGRRSYGGRALGQRNDEDCRKSLIGRRTHGLK